MQEKFFSALAKKLVNEEPRITGRRRAAVSIILTGRMAPRILLIRRSAREGDPWSGQVAFPGGKFQEGDASLKATAIREAREEVGIDLTNSEFLGYLGAFRTHTGDMEVVPALFLLGEEVRVRTNEEATSHMWIALDRLLSREAESTDSVRFGGELREVPAFRVDDYVIWGLTRRIISSMIEGTSA